MTANGLHVRAAPDMVAEKATAFRGWTVRMHFGVATVRDEGSHFAVRVPVRLNWGCHWKDGERYKERQRGAVGRGTVDHLLYRATIDLSPVMAVRLALVHGVKEEK
jgi:hypothetical protein